MFNNKSKIKPSLGSTIDFNHPLSQGLVGCWLFNEQTGNKIYDLAKDNHGNLLNGPIWNSDVDGILKFDGTNDSVDFGDTLDIGLSSYSFCISFKASSLSGLLHGLFSKSIAANATQRYALFIWNISGNYKITTFISNGGSSDVQTSSNINVSTNVWYHVTAVFDRKDKVYLYINGKLDSSATISQFQSINFQSNYNFRIGSYGDASNNPSYLLNGFISNFKIYNRALSAEEVLSLYEQPYQFINPPAALNYYSYSQHRSLAAPSIKTEEKSKTHSFDLSVKQSYDIQKYYKSIIIGFDDSIKLSSSIKINKPSTGIIYQIGLSGSSTYTYRISAVDKFNNETDTLILTTNTGNSTLDSSNYNKLTWTSSQFAFRYKIYGRTAGNELLIDTVSDNYYDDIGNQIINIAYSNTNSTGYNKNNLTLGRYWDISFENNSSYIKSLGENKIFPMFDDLTTGAYVLLIDALKYDDRYNLIFGWKESTLRRIVCYKHDKYTNTHEYIGNITITFPNTNSRGVVDLRSVLYTYSDGYVSVANNNVTGFNTNFLANKFASGARIGFGSRESSKIKKWYEISAFNSSENITILNSNENLNNVFYIIEEIRLIIPLNNTTLGRTELFLFKGLHTEDFKNLYNYTLATNSDNSKNYFSLIETNNIPYNNGIALEPKISNNEQNIYLWTRPTTTTLYIHKYNILQDLTVSSGVSSSSFVFRCGGNLTIPATQYTYMAITYSIPKHAPYLNRPILTLSFTDRILNIPIDKLQADKENIFEFYADTPLIKNSTALNLWSTARLNLDYCELSDRFVFMFRASQTHPSFMGQLGAYDKYIDLFIFTDTRINNLPVMPKEIPNIPSYSDMLVRCCDGYSYFIKGSSQNNNTIYAIPFSGDSKFSNLSANYCITPIINTNKNIILKNFSFISDLVIGENYYETPLEALNFYYKITDFDNENRSWIKIADHGNLDINIDGEIQFRIETKINEITLCPKKLYNLSLQYEDVDNLPFGFSWNLSDTNKETGVIGFIQNKTINKPISLSITIFRKSDNKLIFNQSSVINSNGEFQYFQGSWLRGFGPDQINLRRRYVFNDVLPKNVEYIVRLRTN